MALTSGANEASWLRTLLASLDYTQSEPTVLEGDNQGSIKLAHNPQHHARTKHIDVRHHVIRELVTNKVIQLAHCCSSDNRADILTKSLSPLKFQDFAKLITSSAWGSMSINKLIPSKDAKSVPV